MLKERQRVATGLLQQESSWALGQPQVALGGVASGTTLDVLSIGPLNHAAESITGVSNDIFPGTALLAATTTKNLGVLNTPIGVIDGYWLYLPATGAGASTFQLQVVSASTTAQAPVTSVITAAIPILAKVQGWTEGSLLAVPTERQAVIAGGLQTGVCLLYPGDLVQVVTAGGVAIPAGARLVLDVA